MAICAKILTAFHGRAADTPSIVGRKPEASELLVFRGGAGGFCLDFSRDGKYIATGNQPVPVHVPGGVRVWEGFA